MLTVPLDQKYLAKSLDKRGEKFISIERYWALYPMLTLVTELTDNSNVV